jgi:hypothetical protein
VTHQDVGRNCVDLKKYIFLVRQKHFWIKLIPFGDTDTTYTQAKGVSLKGILLSVALCRWQPATMDRIASNFVSDVEQHLAT